MTIWATNARARAAVGAATVWALFGCADLQPMQASQCGNGVVEEGEDCDLAVDPALGPGTSCGLPSDSNACRYVCGGAPECPIGWGCGLDGACRHATGVFGEPVTTSLLGSRGWTIGLVDDDDLPDLFVALDRDLQVHLGEGNGSFNLTNALRLPRQTGPPAFADLDADGRLDAAVLLESGLLTVHAGPGGVLAPALGQPFEVSDRNRVEFVAAQVAGVSGDLMLMLYEGPDGELTADFESPVSDDPAVDGPAVDLPVPGDVESLAGARVPRANLTGDPAGVEDYLALAFEGSNQVWIVHTKSLGDERISLGAEAMLPALTLPGSVTKLGVSFADVDGDGFPDLIASTDAGVVVAKGVGDGTFAEPGVDARFQALGDTPFPLAAADLDCDGLADYVGQTGVFLTDAVTGDLEKVATNYGEAPWNRVFVEDLDGDGWNDLAASSRKLTTGVRGVDLLFNSGNRVFSQEYVSTTAAVDALAAGDFNGDRVGDVALVENLGEGDDGVTRNRVSVIFGAAGSTHLAVPMADFEAAIRRIASGRFPLTAGEADLAEDLLVDLGAADQSTRFSIMWGGSEERLYAPTHVGNSAQMVVPGRFDESANGVPELLVVSRTAEESSAQLFSAAGAPLSGEVVLPFDAICIRSLVADLDGDDIDEWLVLTSGLRIGECPGTDDDALWVTRFTEGIVPGPATELVGPHTAPYDAVAGDFDGDGRPDLAVSFRGLSSGSRGVSVYWNNGGEIDGLDGAHQLDASASAVDILVGAVNADGDPRKELVAFNDTGAYLADFGVDRFPERSPALVVPGNASRFLGVRSEDVTGDAIGDLLFEASAGDEPAALQVYRGLDHLDVCAPNPRTPVIYLNRVGGVYRVGDDDSRSNTSSIIPADANLLPLTGDVAWSEIVACVKEAFAEFQVVITDEYPGDADHMEIVITGSTAAAFGLDPAITSMTPHLCDGIPQGIGFVFAPAIWPPMPGRCAAAAASAGTLLGLEWTVECSDFMGFDFTCADKAFQNEEIPCGTTKPASCQCGGTSQSSYERLREILGEATCPAE